jgi:hypothetical protein
MTHVDCGLVGDHQRFGGKVSIPISSAGRESDKFLRNLLQDCTALQPRRSHSTSSQPAGHQINETELPRKVDTLRVIKFPDFMEALSLSPSA